MLSERIRPDVEAAPWVIDEVKKLEAENEQLRRRDGFINNLDKQIIEKDKEIDKLLDGLWDIHSMCNNWPLVSAYRIKKHIRLTLGGS